MEQPKSWNKGVVVASYWYSVRNGFAEKITVKRLGNGSYFIEFYTSLNGIGHYTYIRTNKERADYERKKASAQQEKIKQLEKSKNEWQV